ncbi:MAG: portal protein [Nanoarchaeota archaeon]|nr:portal protein [Nanoarchaeota archaeon]
MKILGWKIFDKKKEDDLKKIEALVPSEADAGAVVIGGGAISSVYSFDQTIKNQIDLLEKYRGLTYIPEVDFAIEEIVNEAIVSTENEAVCHLVLDDFPASETFKKKIIDEFNYILNLLDFNNMAYDYFKRFYVDGKIAFHNLIDIKNPKRGLVDIRLFDSRCIAKIKEIRRKYNENQVPIIDSVEEYFIYNENGISAESAAIRENITLSLDSVSYANSGLIDPSNGQVISHLHKVLKIANQLSMIETALIIYRLARAPERKAFYVDVGELSGKKAQQYLEEQMKLYKNKLVYDMSTGELADKKHIMSMMEDIWLPRRAGSSATEIQTLEGGANLSQMEDVQFFKEKLYLALNIPITRLQPDANFTYSKDSAIVREELKFSKFIDKLRKHFVVFLYDLLKKQLILKGIFSPEDWNQLRQYIFIDFQKDSFYSEMKEAELLSEKLDMATTAVQFNGTLLSNDFIWKKIFKFTDDEIEEIKEANKEKSDTESEDGVDTSEEFGNDYLTPEDNQGDFNIGKEEEKPPQTSTEPEK